MSNAEMHKLVRVNPYLQHGAINDLVGKMYGIASVKHSMATFFIVSSMFALFVLMTERTNVALIIFSAISMISLAVLLFCHYGSIPTVGALEQLKETLGLDWESFLLLASKKCEMMREVERYLNRFTYCSESDGEVHQEEMRMKKLLGRIGIRDKFHEVIVIRNDNPGGQPAS